MGEARSLLCRVVERSALKRALHGAGLTGLLHRRRNRRTLTVAGFHRVLDPGDPRFPEADPAWTLTRELFGECLDFLTRHYRVLSLGRLLEAHRSGRPLPERSLLISFDDGWADTFDTALPELQRRGLPAVCFVASRAVGRREPFWREALAAAVRRKRLRRGTFDELWRAAGADDAPPARGRVAALCRRLEALGEAQREELLQGRPELEPEHDRRLMLSPEELRALEEGGVEVGSHGATHEPLDLMADAWAELAGSRMELARLLDRHAVAGPLAFSFPHGRFRPAQLTQATEAGYELVFTSEERLEPLEDGPPPDVLGRVCIDGREVSGPDGRLAPELLALWLFRQPLARR